MSSEEDSAKHHEIVIIRRGGHSEEEGHHGGVWKIAYADFMTAMMAFFLVMWLINAANEETKSQVASYFNPVKLIDSRTSTKGPQDLDAGYEGLPKQEEEAKDAAHEAEKAAAEAASKAGEAEPPAVAAESAHEKLAELAAAAPHAEENPGAVQVAEVPNRPGQSGGEAYLDPFDPQSWQQIAAEIELPEKRDTPADKTSEREEAEEIAAAGIVATALEAAKTGGEKSESPEKASGQAGPAKQTAQDASDAAHEGKDGEAVQAAAAQPGQDTQDTAHAGKNAEAGKAAGKAETSDPEARLIEREIKAALGKASPGAAPLIEVRSTEDGVLISLTDDTSFGMFAIASAEPEPVLVSYMEKIGKVLNARSGKIIISGHTDGRPFRSETYDNWKLSSARAQMAYYMLVRAGVAEKRVERIEGHADRDLKVPGNPEAAENRRIEILLRETKS